MAYGSHGKGSGWGDSPHGNPHGLGIGMDAHGGIAQRFGPQAQPPRQQPPIPASQEPRFIPVDHDPFQEQDSRWTAEDLNMQDIVWDDEQDPRSGSQHPSLVQGEQPGLLGRIKEFLVRPDTEASGAKAVVELAAKEAGMSPEEFVDHRLGALDADQTFPGTVYESAKAVPHTVLQTGASIARGSQTFADALTKPERPTEEGTFFEIGEGISKVAERLFPQNPEYQRNFLVEMSRGLSSLATFAGAGGAGRAVAGAGARAFSMTPSTAKLATRAGQWVPAGSMAAASGVDEAWHNIQQFNQENPDLAIKEDDARDIAIKGAFPGVVQVLSLGPILKRIPAGMRSSATSYLLRRMRDSGATEFSVETAGAVLQDVLRKTYDPDHPVIQNITKNMRERGLTAGAAAMALQAMLFRGQMAGTQNRIQALRQKIQDGQQPSGEEVSFADEVGFDVQAEVAEAQEQARKTSAERNSEILSRKIEDGETVDLIKPEKAETSPPLPPSEELDSVEINRENIHQAMQGQEVGDAARVPDHALDELARLLQDTEHWRTARQEQGALQPVAWQQEEVVEQPGVGQQADPFEQANKTENEAEPLTQSFHTFSQMRETLAKPGLLPKSETKEKMLDMIRAHVGKFKQTELDESGLSQYLENMEGNRVTREDVLDFLEMNAIQLKEVRKEAYQTIYHDYQLPEGKNYQELLLILPENKTETGHGGPMERQTFTSPHWHNENVLLHLRMDEHVDSEGKNTLLIEEVQSDLHQQGRKTGYVSDLVLKSPFALELGVPDAPFKATNHWAMLGMKRAIQDAVDRGFDQVAWTAGDLQAKRYDLSKNIKKVEYYPEDHNLIAYYDESGAVSDNFSWDVEPNQLDRYIGKDLAERLLKSETIQPESGSRAYKRLEGLDLKMGGDGIKFFYDRILPKEVQKYVKKFGSKVEKTTLANGFEVHSFKVTPQMRKAISNHGQPLYKRGDERVDAPADFSIISQELKKVIESSFPNIKDSVHLVESEENLPAQVHLDIKRKKLSGKVPSVYHNGQIYLVTSNINSKRQGELAFLKGLVQHEGRHKFLTDVLGGESQKNRFMTRAAITMNKEVNEWLHKHNLSRSTANRRLAAEEIIADMTKQGRTHRTLDQIVTKIMEWARKIFPNLNLTKAEIRSILADADRALIDAENAATYPEESLMPEDIIKLIQHDGMEGNFYAVENNNQIHVAEKNIPSQKEADYTRLNIKARNMGVEKFLESVLGGKALKRKFMTTAAINMNRDALKDALNLYGLKSTAENRRGLAEEALIFDAFLDKESKPLDQLLNKIEKWAQKITPELKLTREELKRILLDSDPASRSQYIAKAG